MLSKWECLLGGLGVPFSSLSPKYLCSVAGTWQQWDARELRCGGLSAVWLSSGTGRHGRATGQVWQEGCAFLDLHLQVWEVEEMVMATGCPMASRSFLVSASAWLSFLTLRQSWSACKMYTVVWDAFASHETLGVSSSSVITWGSLNLSPVKG